MRKNMKLFRCLCILLFVFDNAYAMKRNHDPENQEDQDNKRLKTAEVSEAPRPSPFEEEAKYLSPKYHDILASILPKFLEIKQAMPHGHHIQLTLQANASIDDYFHLEPPEFQKRWRALLSDMRLSKDIGLKEDKINEQIVTLLLKAFPDQWEDNLFLLLLSPFFAGFHSRAYIEEKINSYENQGQPKGIIFFDDNKLIWISRKGSNPVDQERVLEFVANTDVGTVYDVTVREEIDIEDFLEAMSAKGFTPYKDYYAAF